MDLDERTVTTVIRTITAIVVAAASALALTACTASPEGNADMDKTAVAAAIEELPGVVSAEVGAFNTGTPGSYGARIGITVDDAGFDALGDVVDGSVRIVAADPGEYGSYDFEVTAPDPVDPEVPVILTLARYRDRIPFPQGDYVGSTLTLTREELAEIAAG